MGKGRRFVRLPLIAACSLVFVTSCNNSSSNKKSGLEVSTVEEFKQALSNGVKTILTTDLDFADETIVINHDVIIDSIDGQSSLKNVYFTLSGPTVINEKIDVSFSNISFDGGVNTSSIDFESKESFEAKFGSYREEKKCITGDSGYFSLSLNNCVIKNYASDVGPAVYVENYNRQDDKVVNIDNCKFYNNYSEFDTIHLSNERLIANITNSEFYLNYAYKSAGFSITNGKAVIDKVNVHDNIFVPYDINTGNFQLVGGGVFLGGLDVKMTNSYIVNNKTTYGGGLGVSPAQTGNKSFVIENVSIKDNEATYGGGVAAFSLYGQPIAFINCELLNNKATIASALYTEVYARFNDKNDGGLIQFFFTTFGLNEANDNNTFKFYQTEATKGKLGTISLKGCLAIGNDTYESKAEDYNYIATKEQALLDGVISQDSISHVSNGLYPLKGSKADQKISKDIYSNWSTLLNGQQSLNIGKTNNNSNKTGILLLFLILVPSIIVLILVVVLVIIVLRLKSKKKDNDIIDNSPQDEKDSRQEYLASLNERERKVVELIIAGKKRKEIADELNYSENTIKKDLTIIYSKLHVLDKYALILQYKDLL